MRNTYSLYEAKAKLSAIIRKVREGQPAIVTLHGKPVVEIRAIERQDEGIEARLRELRERGILSGPENPRAKFKSVARIPGALKQFLEDRD